MVRLRQVHDWDLTPKQAIALQMKLRTTTNQRATLRLGAIKTIAGADCAFDRSSGFGYAGIVVFSYPDLEEVQRVGRRTKITFPYVPGLLSFREVPLLIPAFEKLKKLPDVVVCDGQGYAHPRRFGIACHLGLVLDRPTIGCAKSRLIGEHRMPAQRPGSLSDLSDDQELIGKVLRSRRGCKPVFVSVGHKLSLDTATKIVSRCCDGYRIPKPTRIADQFVAKLKREATSKR